MYFDVVTDPCTADIDVLARGHNLVPTCDVSCVF